MAFETLQNLQMQPKNAIKHLLIPIFTTRKKVSNNSLNHYSVIRPRRDIIPWWSTRTINTSWEWTLGHDILYKLQLGKVQPYIIFFPLITDETSSVIIMNKIIQMGMRIYQTYICPFPWKRFLQFTLKLCPRAMRFT